MSIGRAILTLSLFAGCGGCEVGSTEVRVDGGTCWPEPDPPDGSCPIHSLGTTLWSCDYSVSQYHPPTGVLTLPKPMPACEVFTVVNTQLALAVQYCCP
jgi:hypothetical protein